MVGSGVCEVQALGLDGVTVGVLDQGGIVLGGLEGDVREVRRLLIGVDDGICLIARLRLIVLRGLGVQILR